MLQRFGLPSAHGLNGYSVGIVLVLAELNHLDDRRTMCGLGHM
jgi:hypothetical protein